MKKIYKIIIFLSVFFAFNTSLSAENKPDCSMYSTKTLAGLSDKMRCKKGLPPGKNFLRTFSFKKDKDSRKEKRVKKSCDEHTTKTVAGLIGILKCRKDKK